ncbi:WXG100 family type VII secretion target [Crossiella cryophila]|uniref:Uncharacterized protein YukE n=1 Tax=Crossiella cryophila TaxID=43355 RepID=A0A7W7FRA7_9PSEU|nr:hypothetical protein [Crossiella cryophila]MBB4675771.1 uncharacterized protein YukE [Crossiella cryophila]
MSGFRVEHERLSRAAGDFDDYGDRAGTIATELERALTEQGECWGSDAVGRNFARTYLPDAEATLKALGDLPEALVAVSGKLADTAEEYRSSERDAEQKLKLT